MGGFNEGTSGGSGDHRTSKRTSKVGDFIRSGGITGMVIRGIKKAFDPKKNKKSKSGDVYAYDEAKEKIDYKTTPSFNTGGGNDNDPKGIELAKASTGSATILGPGEIQKEAANNVNGPTTTEMSADQILLANKRKGRKITNLTGKKTLAKDYKLSQKTLLG